MIRLTGMGDRMHNMPLFRQDLATPYGSERGIFTEDHFFANLVYTTPLDATILTIPVCRAFMVKLGGAAAGNEIVGNDSKIPADTGVSGQPYVIAIPPGEPALIGAEACPTPVRVFHKKLPDLSGYLFGLHAPKGNVVDAWSVARRRDLFRSNDCSRCHNVDQSKSVLHFIVPTKTIFPGDDPHALLAHRTPPLNPILDTPGNTVAEKVAVITASQRGLDYGGALPLLLDRANTGLSSRRRRAVSRCAARSYARSASAACISFERFESARGPGGISKKSGGAIR